MNQRLWRRSLLLASLIAGTLAAGSAAAEWELSGNLVARLSFAAVGLVLAAAVLSWGLRILRFHVLLAQSGVPARLGTTALAQGIGFALSVMPGAVGEVLKLEVMREREGAPVSRTAPVLVLERLVESSVFVLLALIAALVFPAIQNRLALSSTLPAAAIALLGLLLFRRRLRQWAGKFQLRVGRMALARKIAPRLDGLRRGLRAALTPRQIITGIGLTGLARVADGLVVFIAANMLGVELALPTAVLILAVGGVAGGLSLLPGGAGAVEATMVGLLVLAGAPVSTALSITLLARFSTVWLWVAVGLVMALGVQLARSGAQRGAPPAN